MPQCTAPSRGHKTASGRENCPACRYGARYGGYSGGGSSSYGSRSYTSSGPSSGSGSGSSGSTRRSAKPRWSRSGSSVFYTPTEVETLTPFRETVEQQPPAPAPDVRDLFLCHAWNDRQVAAKELYDLLLARKVSVWFSEVDLGLGTLMLREIDKGLAKSRMGIVLVTPAFLERVQKEGSVSDKELSALLRRNKLIPILHNTTYEALENVSPMLASRTGLSTGEDQTMADVADKISELFAP
ncbi:MAG: toll/interleukin-1 receptor domain-containing protein [Candidatus Obscuribacterales bacterium]|nr:toll/interleukin-1 receptor domain-containing protein [Candidatus Obscuribacterales bacterium]